MISSRIFVACAALTAASLPSALAVDYIVDSQAAFDSLGAIDFEPGDRILLEGGLTFTGSMDFGAEDLGTDANPIIVTSVGTGRATISAGDSYGIRCYNTGGFNISHLKVLGSGVAADGTTTNTSAGIVFYADATGDVKFPQVHLDQIEVTGFGSRGVVVGGYNGSTGYHDVRITNVVSHGNLRSGIETFGFTGVNDALTNVYVGHCTTFHNVGNGTREAPGIVLGGVTGGVIERCLVHDNGRNNRSVGISAYDSTDIVIQFNESYSNKTAGDSGGVGYAFSQGVTHSVMQYNYSHDNDGAGYLVFGGYGTQANSNNILRYNISENDGRNPFTNAAGGIEIGGVVSDLDVHGNTVFMDGFEANTSTPAVYVFGGIFDPTRVLLTNNLFVTAGASRMIRFELFLTGIVTFAGNNYWPSGAALVIDYNSRTYNTLTAWRAGTRQETVNGNATGSSVDPLLVDPGNGGTVGDPDQLATLSAYRLTASSPMIDRGLDLQALFMIETGPQDFYGVTLPQGPGLDVGASEYMAAPTPPPVVLAVHYDRATHTVSIDYQSESGIEFGVRRSPDLAGDPLTTWTILPGTGPGDGTVKRYTDNPPAGSSFFYVLVRE